MIGNQGSITSLIDPVAMDTIRNEEWQQEEKIIILFYFNKYLIFYLKFNSTN